MQIAYTSIDLTSVWCFFLVLQLVLLFGIKRKSLSREFLMPFEIVLISAAVMFFLHIISHIVFFTVICTVAAVTALFHIYPAIVA